MPRFRVKVMEGRRVMGEQVLRASTAGVAVQQAMRIIRQSTATHTDGSIITFKDLAVGEFEEPEEASTAPTEQSVRIRRRKYSLQDRAETLLGMFISSAHERAESGISRDRALTQAAEAAASYTPMVGPDIAHGLYEAFVAAFDEASEE